MWILLVPAVYAALAAGSALLRASGHEAAGSALFAIFRGWCHQMPERTLFLAGFPMAVCARCFALAVGVVAGCLMAGRISGLERSPRRIRLPFWAMCLAAAPMALDGFTQLFGFRESTNTLRVATGLTLGFGVAFWIVPTLYDAFDEMRGNTLHG